MNADQPPQPAADSGDSKLRLKPRLTPAQTPGGEDGKPADSRNVPAPAGAEPDRVSPPSGKPDAAPLPQLSAPRETGGGAQPGAPSGPKGAGAVPLPPATGKPLAPMPPPPEPLRAPPPPPAAAAPVPPAFPKPPISGLMLQDKVDVADDAMATAATRKSKRMVFLAIVVVAVLVGGSFLVGRMFSQKGDAPASPVAPSVAAPAAAPVVAPAAALPVSPVPGAPAARDVAQREAKEPVGTIVDTGAKGMATEAPPAAVSSAAPEADQAFKSFVVAARINGVFQGNPPRLLLNGRTVRRGELVAPELGIVLEEVDIQNRTIQFKNREGAVVSRRY